jgi:hypothetical protein
MAKTGSVWHIFGTCGIAMARHDRSQNGTLSMAFASPLDAMEFRLLSNPSTLRMTPISPG